MKKLLLVAGLLVGGLTFGGTSTLASSYNSSGDIHVNINLLPDQLQFSNKTGDAMFQLQESAHNTLTEMTGLKITHSYAWVNINGARVLAIDPPKPCFNR